MIRFLPHLALIMAAVSAFFYVRSLGYQACTAETRAQTIKELTHENQSFARRPRSDDDLVNELCRRGIAAAKNDRSTDRELLSWCGKRVSGRP